MTIYKAGDTVREVTPRIVVFGIGGAGGNAVNNMIDAELAGVEFVAANTDSQALARSKADTRLQLGARITGGLGAGGRPEVGAEAAEDTIDAIKQLIDGAHMVFITAGMGGGTGTGAAPVVARVARELGVLTAAVVTRPFAFEGSQRAQVAIEGLEKLEEQVDTLIVIPNQNLFRLIDAHTSLAEAFAMADGVLHAGVRGVTELITRDGLINLDFADVRAVMSEAGLAMMGTGEAHGERRASEAALAAITNPLLDDVTLSGARAVLINIAGGADMTLFEIDEVANEIRQEADPDARIIVGSALDETLDGALRVSVLATGVDGAAAEIAAAALAAQPQETPAARFPDGPHGPAGGSGGALGALDAPAGARAPANGAGHERPGAGPAFQPGASDGSTTMHQDAAGVPSLTPPRSRAFTGWRWFARKSKPHHGPHGALLESGLLNAGLHAAGLPQTGAAPAQAQPDGAFSRKSADTAFGVQSLAMTGPSGPLNAVDDRDNDLPTFLRR